MATILLAIGLGGAAWAQQYQLCIGYKLPDNPDLVSDARNLEANALSKRNMELQACASGNDPSQCERNAEIAFRRRISAIPGARFILTYNTKSMGKSTHWLLDLQPKDAVDTYLDQVFEHLQPESVGPLGIYVDFGNCQFVRNRDNQPISYPEDFRRTVCKLIAAGLLMQLIRTDHPQAHEVAFLLDHGADVNAKDKAYHDWTALMGAAIKGHANVAKLLLDHGADVNAKSDLGLTALMVAAVKGNADVAKLLLNHGANVNAMANEELTALMVAAGAGHADVAKLLLDRGADVNAMAKKSGTALMWAAGADVGCRQRACRCCQAPA